MQPADRSDVWGVCHELAVAIHRATAEWPLGEMYGLAARARQAAFLAAINVAEDPSADGSAVVTVHPPSPNLPARRLRLRRLRRALGRLRFLDYVLSLAYELGYLAPDTRNSLDQLRHRAEELTRAQFKAESALQG